MAGAVGVFQKEDGYWGYRFSIIVDAVLSVEKNIDREQTEIKARKESK